MHFYSTPLDSLIPLLELFTNVKKTFDHLIGGSRGERPAHPQVLDQNFCWKFRWNFGKIHVLDVVYIIWQMLGVTCVAIAVPPPHEFVMIISIIFLPSCPSDSFRTAY